jgi:hypothetical protein
MGVYWSRSGSQNGNSGSSLSRIEEGHVGIVYEGSQADIVVEKIALEELVNR